MKISSYIYNMLNLWYNPYGTRWSNRLRKVQPWGTISTGPTPNAPKRPWR